MRGLQERGVIWMTGAHRGLADCYGNVAMGTAM
jgi:hypothetical protein